MSTSNEELIKLIRAVFYPLLFTCIIVIIHVTDWLLQLHLSHWGIYPQKIKGLAGVIFAPFLHSDYKHLINNSIPICILGTALFYFYKQIAMRVVAILWFTTGLCVWIGGRDSYHIGASGLVYGLASFLFFSGIFRRNINLMAISLLTVFLYGSLIWGIFPIWPEISWESHLFGGLSGMAFAFVYKNEKLYQQEPELVVMMEEDNDDDPYWNVMLEEEEHESTKNENEYDFKNLSGESESERNK